VEVIIEEVQVHQVPAEVTIAEVVGVALDHQAHQVQVLEGAQVLQDQVVRAVLVPENNF
jgi:hypothetical protein